MVIRIRSYFGYKTLRFILIKPPSSQQQQPNHACRHHERQNSTHGITPCQLQRHFITTLEDSRPKRQVCHYHIRRDFLSPNLPLPDARVPPTTLHYHENNNRGTNITGNQCLIFGGGIITTINEIPPKRQNSTINFNSQRLHS